VIDTLRNPFQISFQASSSFDHTVPNYSGLFPSLEGGGVAWGVAWASKTTPPCGLEYESTNTAVHTAPLQPENNVQDS